MEKKRNIALGFLFGATVLVAFGVLYRDWWSGQVFAGVDPNIGVRSATMCCFTFGRTAASKPPRRSHSPTRVGS